MDIAEISTILNSNPDLLSSREKARAFLADVFFNNQVIVNVMMNAYDVGIIESVSNPTPFTFNQIISSIISRYGVSEERAKEAVLMWISILLPHEIDLYSSILHDGKNINSGSNVVNKTEKSHQASLTNNSHQENSNRINLQPTAQLNNKTHSSTQTAANSVNATNTVQNPQQSINQNVITGTSQNSPAAALINTSIQINQPNNNPIPVSASVNTPIAKRKSLKTTIVVISVASLLVLVFLGVGLSKFIKARTDSLEQSRSEESRAAAGAADSRSWIVSTTSSLSDGDNSTTSYETRVFEDLSFEIPSGSRMSYDSNNPDAVYSNGIAIGLPSDGAGIMVFSYPIDSMEIDFEVNAGTEQYFVDGMRDNYFQDHGATNIDRLTSRIDGMIAACGTCNIDSLPSAVYVFCNKDYSNLYVVLFQVYNSYNYTSVDEDYVIHFIDSISMR